MDSVKISQSYKKHKKIVDSYFENNGKKLYKTVDKILFELKFNVENSDFYSLASEIFLDVLCRYDETHNFDDFLYICLTNRFKTEMTRRNRKKRKCDANAISIHTPIGNEGDGFTIGDTIESKSTVEQEFFEKRKEAYSSEMCKYLSRLSKLQQEVLHLISIGFIPSEIMEELHINKKVYEDCYAAIHSYRNIKVFYGKETEMY